MCQTTVQSGRPLQAAQFLGSANTGLGFHHVDVEPRVGRFRHWKGYDNYRVFVIEEGDVGEEGIVEGLREQVDRLALAAYQA